MIYGEDWYVIRQMLHEGMSVSEVARRTGRDRKTIVKVREAPEHPPQQRRRRRGSKLDPYVSYLQVRVAAGVSNAVKLGAELRRMGYLGSESLVRQYVHTLRPLQVSVTERFETPPGHQAQVDWAICGHIWHRGRLHLLSAFVFTLGYSRRQYVEFTVSQDQAAFLRCHVHAFRFFGGVPHEVLYDNLKTAVEGRNAEGEVVWNRHLRDFADAYGFIPRACQPYRPQTKGKVESGVRYLKGNFLLGLDLAAATLEGLNGEVMRWVRETADVRVHGTTHERPTDRWAAEMAALQPLDGHPDYDTSIVSYRLVTRDSFISYQGSRYAVPPAHAGQVVLLRESDAGTLRVYAGQECVTEHPIAQQPGELVSTPDHAATVRALARASGRQGRPPNPRSFPVTLPQSTPTWQSEGCAFPNVEIRALSTYDEAVRATARTGED